MDRSKCFTLVALPDRAVHSDTNSAPPGSILARQQLRAKTKSLTFPPLSIARYWRERKCPIFETVAKGDSNPGSLDCESEGNEVKQITVEVRSTRAKRKTNNEVDG